VEEPDTESAISILRGLKERYEVHHKVRIKDEAIIAAVELSQRYISDRFLPDKAIDLMDEAASKLRMQMNSMPIELDVLERKIRQLEIEREAIKRENDTKKLEDLNREIANPRVSKEPNIGMFFNLIAIVFKKEGIRTSIFVDPFIDMIEGAKLTGTDRIELYTENFAHNYKTAKDDCIKPYITAAIKASEIGLGINAGHDLDLENLAFFKQNIPNLTEVSIGHALVCDALYLGLHNTIQQYKSKLI
jgi:ATP-dependent Clp protease ATP-binding subunit ClpA